MTPQSHGSSDSLHLSAPSQSNAPTTHEDVHEEGGTDTQLEHVQADGVCCVCVCVCVCDSTAE